MVRETRAIGPVEPELAHLRGIPGDKLGQQLAHLPILYFRFCGKDLAGAVLYAAVCRACRIGARGPKMEDPHYVETPHVLCVFFFHVVR